MMSFDASKMMQAVTAGAGAAAVPGIRQKPVQLSPLAQLVAAQHIAPAFSPIVVAGIVRLAEFALIALTGIAAYFGYVYPAYGVFDWYYIATAFGVAALAIDRVPGRRHLPDPCLPQSGEPVRAPHRRVVDRVPRRGHARLLRAARRHVFAPLARELLRHRAVHALRRAACALRHRAALDPRGPARPPRGGRRRRRSGRKSRHRAERPVRLRCAPRRRVRRPRRRARADRLRRPAEARLGRRSGRVRAPHARRSGDLLAADLGRRPHPADAEEALGAAGRHPPLGAHQQAALPPALLFLHRLGAGARRVRPPDRRLGRRDEMAVRQGGRRPRADRRARR